MSEAYSINRIRMAAAIAEEISRQHPDVKAHSRIMNACIKAANAVADECERVPPAVAQGMTIREWLLTDDTGSSSRYMASILDDRETLSIHEPYSFPRDCGGFGRCVRMVRAVGYSHRIQLMVGTGKEWSYIAKHWAQMTALFDKEEWADLNIMLRLSRTYEPESPSNTEAKKDKLSGIVRKVFSSNE